MSDKAIISPYKTRAKVEPYTTRAIIEPYKTRVTNIEHKVILQGEQPISSIKTTAQFYNEIRLETGYSDTQNVNPLTNFSDSSKPNATQATPSKQGEYVANDINGHPSILLDGVDDFYDLGDSYEDVFRGNFGGVIVVKPLNGQSGSNVQLWGVYDNGGNDGTWFNFLGDGKLRVNYRSSATHSVYPTDNVILVSGVNPYMVLSWFWDFVNDIVYIRKNGVNLSLSSTGQDNVSRQDPTAISIARNPYIGCINLDGTPTNFVNARFAAPPVLFNSFSDLQNAETKLNQKYAIY